MRNVAAEAGLTTGSLTHYFPDKSSLLLHTLQTSLEHRHSQRSNDDLPPVAALRATLLSALPLDDDRRRHWLVTMAFCAEAVADPRLAIAQRDAYRSFHRRVADAARRCAAAPDETADRLIAAVDGVAVQALFDPQRWTADRQTAVLDAALRQLA
jgi:AcrR family transcriptional regulator